MFGQPGHLYVYLSYGVHHCANLVTEPDGVAGAVLMRAASVERGVEAVRRRRGERVATDALLRGPGNLCRGLGLTLLDNGLDVCAATSRVHLEPRVANPPVSAGPRVGITVAAGRVLRFAWPERRAVWVTGPRGGSQSRKKGPDRTVGG
jgi:DNA-3-methyladenine glycosylase